MPAVSTIFLLEEDTSFSEVRYIVPAMYVKALAIIKTTPKEDKYQAREELNLFPTVGELFFFSGGLGI